MDQKTLVGNERKETGKGHAGRLRRSGRIPGVVYGHSEPVCISIERKEFDTKFHKVSENTIIKLTVGKKVLEVLVKDYQENTLRGEITHLDFFEIEKGKLLKTNVPVHITGSAKGVREGGILENSLHEVEVECLPNDIPEMIDVDVTALGIGDSIHVSNLVVSDKVKILNNPDQTIVSVIALKVAPLEPEGAGEAEAEDQEEAEPEEDK